MSAPVPLVLCGDLGPTGCGVGASEAVALGGLDPAPRTADPTRLGLALREVRAARRDGRPVVVVFPTRSTVRSARALVAMAGAAAAGRRVRWHLHEYSIFGERRLLLDALMALSGGPVVVSTASEGEAVRAARGGRVARRCTVHVVPPASGTPAPDRSAGTPVEPAIAGVFGTARADKGFDRLVAAVRALPAAYRTVETVGRGWAELPWPADVAERVVLVHHGWQDDAEAAATVRRWTLAVAPFAGGATDGRMSLRTPLALGVPTLTHVTRADDLTLRPPHLLIDAATAGADALALGAAARRAGAEEVARFEAAAVAALAGLLWPEALAPEPVPA
jgi:hypothetical protein